MDIAVQDRIVSIEDHLPGDDVPSQGVGDQGLLGNQGVDDAGHVIQSQNEYSKMASAARNRFYPGWWLRPHDRVLGACAPFYRVECVSRAEAELAKEVQPVHVDAEIVVTSVSSA
jgi:hypothetical protein